MGKRKIYFKQKGTKRLKGKRSLSEFNRIKGILFTCPTTKEYDASQEALNLLQEYSEDLLEQLDDSEVSDEPEKSLIEHSSVSKQLEQEVNQLKEEQVFELLDVNIQGIIFVRIVHKALCPVKLLIHIFEKFKESPENINCRYLQRFVPVSSTCHAKPENFKQITQEQIQKYIADLRYDDINTVKPMFITYGVIYKAVYSTKALSKQDCLDIITPLLPMNHVVDLKKPNVAIFVYVLKNVATLSIANNYTKLFEFNLNNVRKMHKQAIPVTPIANSENVVELTREVERKTTDISQQSDSEALDTRVAEMKPSSSSTLGEVQDKKIEEIAPETESVTKINANNGEQQLKKEKRKKKLKTKSIGGVRLL
jgi:hypothetical protein